MSYDVIVVGSGCTGAIAAATLVDAGRDVAIFDAGITGEHMATPRLNFRQARRSDPRQFEYFLGPSLQGLPRARFSTGAQLTPARAHVTRDTDRYSPVAAAHFEPLESLAYGGLGTAWGAGCFEFSDSELRAAGLPPAKMRRAYQWVADRIGVSSADDDAKPYTLPTVTGTQPPVELDDLAATLLANWHRRRARLHRRGLRLGRPALAVLTRPFDGREPYAYRNMDWYDDYGLSVWRPAVTVEALRSAGRVDYIGDILVTGFSDDGDQLVVSVLNMATGASSSVRCRVMVLATGTLQTARVVLRSSSTPDARLPLLCNPYVYYPAMVLSRLGRVPRADRCGLVQLSMFHDPDGTNSDVAMASLYAYESLLLSRVAGELPIGLDDARALLQFLLPALVIAGIHQPDAGSRERWCGLEPNAKSPTGDSLRIEFSYESEEHARIRARNHKFAAGLRRLGAWPLRRIEPPPGASIHYAGTLPFSDQPAPLRLACDGRLHGTRRVWVADGSGFRYLPAKGLTFSLMANAHLVSAAAAAS